MFPFYKKFGKTIFDILLFILTVWLVMFLFSSFYKIAAPILFSFVIFAIINPLSDFLHKKGLKRTLSTFISTFLFISIIVVSLTLFGVMIKNQVQQLAEILPKYGHSLGDEIKEGIEYSQDRYASLPPEVVEKIKTYSTKAVEKGASFSAEFLGSVNNVISSLAGLFVLLGNVAIGTILAFFLSLEIDNWRKVAKKKTPNTFKRAIDFLKKNVLKGISGYVKAQFKLISITFVLVFVGLLSLGKDNVFTIALLAAVLDLVPLLGVSVIFLPWVIYLFVVGKTTSAIWLAVIWLVVILVRQILEPFITGDSLGVSAFTMLVAMILSLSIFGIAGMILSPVIVILMKALYDEGYLKKWIRLPKEEFEDEKE